MGPTRWLIVGTGTVARRMASDLDMLPESAVHVATVSRSWSRATAFNAAAGSEAAAFADLDEALAATRPDLAYVATPNSTHAELAQRIISQGVGVLVEKPFTCGASDTAAVFASAASAGVYACEAMWTRFNPVVRALREELGGGAIGEITGVRTAQGFQIAFDPDTRVWNPALGGGASLDLGCYGLAVALLAPGAVQLQEVSGRLAPNGLDASAEVNLRIGRATATLKWTLLEDLRGAATFTGTEGTATLAAPFQRTTHLTVVGHRNLRLHRPLSGLGFVPMIRAVGKDLRTERLVSEHIGPRESVDIAQLVDGVRTALTSSEPLPLLRVRSTDAESTDPELGSR